MNSPALDTPEAHAAHAAHAAHGARDPHDAAGGAPADDGAAELERLVHAIASLETIVAGWDESRMLTVTALKSAIEDLHKSALTRLLRALRPEAAAMAVLRQAMADPVVYGVLSFHGLVREPLESRVRKALAEVRPLLQAHGGDVELVALDPPDAVDVRLTGACHGCPASATTLTEGVERSIRAHCPEILHIRQVSRGAPEASRSTGTGRDAEGGATIHFISPFATHAHAGWVDVAAVDEIPQGDIAERSVGGRSVLLSAHGTAISCFDNRCAHLGMPLDMGAVAGGTITCPYHGFRYALESGECLTAPEVQLTVHAVRVAGGRVQVRVQD